MEKGTEKKKKNYVSDFVTPLFKVIVSNFDKEVPSNLFKVSSIKNPQKLSEIRGYQQFRLEGTCRRGGVVVYVRNSVKAKLWDDVPSDTLELICIEIEPSRSKPILLLPGIDHQVLLSAPLTSCREPLLT